MSENVNTHAQKQTSGMAIAALVLGIIAIISSWVPIINNFSFLLAALGLIFAIIGMVGVVRGKKGGKGVAIAALVINVLSLVIVLATQSLYTQAIDDATVTTDEVAVEQSANSAESTESKYAISGEEITGDEYSVSITGTLKNNTDSEVSYIGLTYNLYDKDGNQIDTAYANTTNLAAGGSWKFEAFGTSAKDEVASYKLTDVSGF